MKMKPILMGQESMLALLAGRKTETRRLVQPQPDTDKRRLHRFELIGRALKGPNWIVWGCSAFEAGPLEVKRPIADVGDVLWVREAWRIHSWDDAGTMWIQYRADGYFDVQGRAIPDDEDWSGDKAENYLVQSTEDALKAGCESDDDCRFHWKIGEAPTRWRLGMFMPKWASRMRLEVTDRRIEWLQYIDDEGAAREGVLEPEALPASRRPCLWAAYANWWDRLNAKRGYSWDSNPLVWVYQFKVLT